MKPIFSLNNRTFQSLTIEDSLSGLVEGRTQQLCSALHDVAKLCANEESSMDNIVDMEMAVSYLDVTCSSHENVLEKHVIM